MDKIVLSFCFRWPLKQIADNQIECQIPCGKGTWPINPEFASEYKLSETEIKQAEEAVLKAIAIIH